MNLRARLGLVFVSFLALVTISVATTALMVASQDRDATVINQAGRQRMLVQRIANLTLQLDGSEDDAANCTVIAESRAMFDETLHSLIAGGETRYLSGQTVHLPATRSPAIRDQLYDLERDWVPFSRAVTTLLSESPDDPTFEAARVTLQALAPELSAQADAIVRLYEAESDRQMGRLRAVQVGFFVCATLLVVAGIGMTRRGILQPLSALSESANKIGGGDLVHPVEVRGPAEIAALATAFDGMRAQLKNSTDLLEARVDQRTRELTALYDVIREIAARLEIEHVLASVTEKARDLLRSDVSFLCLLDGSGEKLSLQAHAGPPDAVSGTCALVRDSAISEILTHPHAVICDVRACPTMALRYRSSHMAAPLQVAGRVIGALCVGNAHRATYSHEQVRLLTELANFSAIALENARLHEQAELIATLEERQRIAADMHDGLAQTLSYIRLKLEHVAGLVPTDTAESVPELGLMRAALERANDEVRESIASLRAGPRSERPLRELIEETVSAFTAAYHEPQVTIGADQAGAVVLPAEDVTQILHIVQEALLNARRHGQATRVSIRLCQDGPHYTLAIADNGTGFEPGHLNQTGHFGISIMQARAGQLGGRLSVGAAPACGAQVTLSWPARTPAIA